MRINTNITAMNTYTQYSKNNSTIAKSVAKLSSGSAINSAADNAAGLAISEKMRAQIRGLEKSSANAQDAISLIQSAEGALGSSTEILQRMRELAIQSSSDTNNDDIDRTALQDEFSQLQSELDEIAKNTTFNKKNLLDGSLATTTKNMSTSSLANSGMTVQLGNASTGTYNFSVSTKLEGAAVAGKEPTTAELVKDSTGTYFTSTSTKADGTTPIDDVTLGGNVEKSDLLNGNYSLSASYSDDTKTMTVTATGDNGQSFSATVNQASLESLAGSTTAGAVTLQFNAEADDAFQVNVNLTNTIASNKTNFETLATNISNMTVSISGGVTAKEAEYGVYANLTGAESVKLESGMDSVSFTNGVKVNFDTLTASSVDTTNKATIDNIAANGIGGGTSTGTWSKLTANDDSAVANGNLDIKTTVTGTAGEFVATDANGVEFTANVADVTTLSGADGTTTTTTLTFKDDAGNNSFTMDYTLTSTGAKATVSTNASAVTASVSEAGHNYSKTFGEGATQGASITNTAVATSAFNAAPTAAAFSNFSAASTSNVAAGSMQITSASTAATTAGNVTFTAEDASGKTYTSNVLASSALLSTTASTSLTNELTFTDNADPTNTFTLNLNTTSTAAATQYFALADATGTTVTVGNDLQASTDSDFSIEAKDNAGLTFQVGANEGDEMVINIDKMDANYLGVSSASVATSTAAAKSITAVDDAINQVSAQRAYLGAMQNRLEYKIDNLSTSSENLTSAESQIRDVDMAKEMTKFTNSNILSQAATAMLAQANSLPQGVLSLIGG